MWRLRIVADRHFCKRKDGRGGCRLCGDVVMLDDGKIPEDIARNHYESMTLIKLLSSSYAPTDLAIHVYTYAHLNLFNKQSNSIASPSPSTSPLPLAATMAASPR